jgi:hypothetical protein
MRRCYSMKLRQPHSPSMPLANARIRVEGSRTAACDLYGSRTKVTSLFAVVLRHRRRAHYADDSHNLGRPMKRLAVLPLMLAACITACTTAGPTEQYGFVARLASTQSPSRV